MSQSSSNIPQNTQTQSKQILAPKQTKLDNTLTYHRWFLGMDCRKDILIQNQVMNKKILNKNTPFKSRVQTLFKNNKMRLAYFFGFCVLFNLGKVYDWIVLENQMLKSANSKIQSAVSSHSNIIKQQYEINRKIKQANINEQKKKQLINIFMKLDKKINLDGNFMRSITKNIQKQKYNEQYVDLGSFIKYFKDQSVQDLKYRINGEYPALNLLS